MRSPILRAAALAALLVVGADVWAAPAKSSSHPGFLSLQPFLDLAEPDDDITEDNVGPELLGSISKGIKDPDTARMLSGIVSQRDRITGCERVR